MQDNMVFWKGSAKPTAVWELPEEVDRKPIRLLDIVTFGMRVLVTEGSHIQVDRNIYLRREMKLPPERGTFVSFAQYNTDFDFGHITEVQMELGTKPIDTIYSVKGREVYRISMLDLARLMSQGWKYYHPHMGMDVEREIALMNKALMEHFEAEGNDVSNWENVIDYDMVTKGGLS